MASILVYQELWPVIGGDSASLLRLLLAHTRSGIWLLELVLHNQELQSTYVIQRKICLVAIDATTYCHWLIYFQTSMLSTKRFCRFNSEDLDPLITSDSRRNFLRARVIYSVLFLLLRSCFCLQTSDSESQRHALAMKMSQ